MTTILVYRDGAVREADAVDPAWLQPGAPEVVWVDIATPTDAEKRILTDTLHFHELAVEDAVLELHHPKIETYGGMLYLILHGIVAGQTGLCELRTCAERLPGF